MEINEGNIAQIITALFAGLAMLFTAWANYRLAKLKEEQVEIKHLVNSTQTNLQTSIDDLRAENKGLRQSAIPVAPLGVPATAPVVQVEVMNKPSDPVPVEPKQPLKNDNADEVGKEN